MSIFFSVHSGFYSVHTGADAGAQLLTDKTNLVIVLRIFIRIPIMFFHFAVTKRKNAFFSFSLSSILSTSIN